MVWLLQLCAVLSATSALLLHDSFLATPFDARSSLALAKDVPVEELDIPLVEVLPLTHHVFNLYINSPNLSERRVLIEILRVMVSRGADVNAVYRHDPDLIFKAVMLREMELAIDIAKAGAMLNSPLIFQQLYSLPCDPIPLSKMLLHGQTILSGKKSIPQMDDLIKFYSGASLGVGAKPAVRATELSRLSQAFNSSVLENIIHRNFMSDISLVDILSSLSEVSSQVHWTLLTNLLNMRESEEDTRPMSFIAEILSLPNDQGRNVLHFLALSGGSSLVADLLRFFNQTHSDGVDSLRQGLSTSDRRGFLPIHYAVMRYGNDSPFTQLFLQFYYWTGGNDFSPQEMQLTSELGAPHSRDRVRSHPTVMEVSNVDGDHLSLHQASDWNGGWNVEKIDNDTRGDGRCDIHQVWSGLPTPEEFFDTYLRKGIPVIFRNALQQQNHSLLNLFQKEQFLSTYGADPIPISQIPYAHTFGKEQKMVHFNEYIAQYLISQGSSEPTHDDPPLYAFNVPLPQWKDRMENSVMIPSILKGLVADTEMQFYLGGVGTGAPVHYHGHAINSLAYGEKRWILFPPETSFYSTEPSLTFFRGDRRVEEAMQCLQKSGDVMFVPSLWGHGTLNTKESIGVAHEFSVENLCME